MPKSKDKKISIKPKHTHRRIYVRRRSRVSSGHYFIENFVGQLKDNDLSKSRNFLRKFVDNNEIWEALQDAQDKSHTLKESCKVVDRIAIQMRKSYKDPGYER